VERLNLLAMTQEQARRVQQIMDTVPDGVLLLDAGRRIVLANPAAWAFLSVLADGFDPNEPLSRLGGLPVEDLYRIQPETLWRELETKVAPQRFFEVAARPVESMAHQEGLVLVLRDVTKERENQSRIQMQERLATVGQLAAGIAHDFNNIMSAIVVYTDLLGMELQLHPASRERLGIIQQQVQRASSLIRQILDFSRRSIMEQADLDLLPFIKELDKLLGRVLPENIRLELTYQPGTYMVNADPTRLQQVFMNLALNARDAMPSGGTLHFELQRLSIRPESQPPFPGLAPGDWISIRVADSGAGIPAEVLPFIFDPFFTTKPVGKGTGLGLSQAYGIIQQHGGGIDVRSRPGEGTTFIIYLKALPVPEEAAALPQEPSQEIVGAGETVLIAEDDGAARNALRALLETQNYRVLAASNGVEALGLFEKEPQSIELVVSDVVMPEMGGVALYQALRQRRPQVKMLFVTGHPLSEENQALLQDSQVRWLQKPFSMKEFTGVLKTLLADPA
jgi:signal transduction histidine kinase